MGQTCGGPSLEGTSEEISAQVDALEAKISKAERDLRQYVVLGATDPAAKQRALQLMRRKKVFEEQRQQLIGAQFNVDNLADQEEQAKFTLKAVKAMQAGRDKLKKNSERMSSNQVDRILDDATELADEMRNINEALAQGSGLLELESEFAQLQREMMADAGAQAAQGAPMAARSASGHREQLAAGAYGAAPPVGAYGAAPPAAAARREHKPWEVPAPPPPPPPRRGEGVSRGASTVDEEYANAWASSALKAAMAPYGHLPGAGPSRASFAHQHSQQWKQRVPLAA
ncbi:unnamed protein product [Prorocentrum cordatum]|uniref:Uncharacterized protein n=1 Tax=Prorocentrum cordatum TaxID=2364126 RepID=A0ABN9SM67_9DINO|nr:unnamed protein product [Polarella glacialis]